MVACVWPSGPDMADVLSVREQTLCLVEAEFRPHNWQLGQEVQDAKHCEKTEQVHTNTLDGTRTCTVVARTPHPCCARVPTGVRDLTHMEHVLFAACAHALFG